MRDEGDNREQRLLLDDGAAQSDAADELDRAKHLGQSAASRLAALPVSCG